MIFRKCFCTHGQASDLLKLTCRRPPPRRVVAEASSRLRPASEEGHHVSSNIERLEHEHFNAVMLVRRPGMIILFEKHKSMHSLSNTAAALFVNAMAKAVAQSSERPHQENISYNGIWDSVEVHTCGSQDPEVGYSIDHNDRTATSLSNSNSVESTQSTAVEMRCFRFGALSI